MVCRARADPLGASPLEFTTPLWVLLLAPLVLGEKLSRIGMLAGLLGFIGILIVTRPGRTEISPV